MRQHHLVSPFKDVSEFFLKIYSASRSGSRSHNSSASSSLSNVALPPSSPLLGPEERAHAFHSDFPPDSLKRMPQSYDDHKSLWLNEMFKCGLYYYHTSAHLKLLIKQKIQDAINAHAPSFLVINIAFVV